MPVFTTTPGTTTLAPFESLITMPTVPPPVPNYKLPTEDLFDIRYTSTTNHFWSFQNTTIKPWAMDNAPATNFLTSAIQRRVNEFDSAFESPPEIKQDVSQSSIFVSLSSDSNIPKGLSFGPTFASELPFSIVLADTTTTSQSCVTVVNDLKRERPYLRKCLLDPGDCDYGLSLALWVKFRTMLVTTKEIILTTAPYSARGFTIFTENGGIYFEVRSSARIWTVRAPFQKNPNTWTNIGVSWGITTQKMSILVDGAVIGKMERYKGDVNLATMTAPKSLLVGCTMNPAGGIMTESLTKGMAVGSIALWYWPLANIELFPGGLERYFLWKNETIATTEAPPKPYYADYTPEVEEFIPLPDSTYPPNPIYRIADYYESMQNLTIDYGTQNIAQGLDRTGIRNAIRLTSADSYKVINQFKINSCPNPLELCVDGISMGVWLYIPSSLDAVNNLANIIELYDSIRVSIFAQYLNVLVKTQNKNLAFRIFNSAPRDVWFNLGFSLRLATTTVFRAYFNGVPMPVSEMLPPTDPRVPVAAIKPGSLVFGSATGSQSAQGVLLNDLVIWFRQIFDIEANRLIGYTRAQMNNLAKATYYWTPDLYIYQDSDVQAAVRSKYNYFKSLDTNTNSLIPNYAYCSMYKSKRAKFRYVELDQEAKSLVPTFDMKTYQYLMLGRRKSRDVTTSVLTWFGECLHDPGLIQCSGSGFTISYWIKLISVGSSRLRYYLNSGDAGSKSQLVNDHRGVSIFSDASLLGASVSQFALDWVLVLDSSSYQLGQWVNVGVLWRADVGLTLLIDGVNYGSMVVKGSKVYKSRPPPPFVVLGRFDTDDTAQWLSAAEAEAKATQSNGYNSPSWEMSNFALGEVAYFDRLLDQDAYVKQVNLLGLSQLRGFDGYVWYGPSLIDAPYSTLAKAAAMKISRPGPVFGGCPNASVRILDQIQAVEMQDCGALRLGVFDSDECPSVSKCVNGLSIGGWFRIGGYDYKPTVDDTTPVILFAGANGAYGLSVSQNGQQMAAWIKNGTSALWLCTSNSMGLGDRQMNLQWFHIAMIWSETNQDGKRVLTVYFNGFELITCPMTEITQSTTLSKFFIQSLESAELLLSTESQNFLLISAKGLELVKASLSVALVTLKPSALPSTKITELMGIGYNQLLTVQRSTFVWAFDGLLKRLYPDRVIPVRAYSEQDQYDYPRGAFCTEGNHQSYVILTGDQVNMFGTETNLQHTCLVDPSNKCTYVFSIEFKILALPAKSTSADLELFRSLPFEAPDRMVGLRIWISADQTSLIAEVRESEHTSRNTAPIELVIQPEKWTNLQVIHIAERPIQLRNNGHIIAAVDNGTYTADANIGLTADLKSQLKMIVGAGLKMCVGTVAYYNIPYGFNVSSMLDNNTLSCYNTMNDIAPFEGQVQDRFNRSNKAFQLETIKNKVDWSKYACLFNPEGCLDKSVTVSLWIKVDGVRKGTEISNEPNCDKPITAVILTTGPPTNTGYMVQLTCSSSPKGNALNLQFIVSTTTLQWSVDSPDALTFGRWTNIAFSWTLSSMDNSGKLEVYLDGIRKQSSTYPRKEVYLHQLDTSYRGVYVGASYNNYPNPAEKLKQYLVVGAISDLVYWEGNVLSCTRPRKLQQLLTGNCNVNKNLPETVRCTVLQQCMQADGSVCLDPTLANFDRMARQADKISDPMDYLNLMKLAITMMNDRVQGVVTEVIDQTLLFTRSIMVIVQAWPNNLDDQTIAELKVNSISPIDFQTKVLQTINRITTLFANPYFEPAIQELIRLHEFKSESFADSMAQVILQLSILMEKPRTCVQMNSVTNDNSFAASTILDLSNNCTDRPSSTVVIQNQISSGQKNQRSVEFLLDPKQFCLTSGSKDQTNRTFAVSEVASMFDSSQLLMGGLPTYIFDSSALDAQPVGLETENTKMLKATDKVAQLAISGPVISVKTDFGTCQQQQQQPTPQNPSINSYGFHYTVQLTKPNQYMATYYYEVTGRQKWKSRRTEQNPSTNDSILANGVRCVYWNGSATASQAGRWSTDGCILVDTNITHVHCACNHFTIFSTALEPMDAPGKLKPIWEVWGVRTQQENENIIRIILLVTNSLSIIGAIGLLLLMIVARKRTLLSHTMLGRSCLCLSLIGFHLALLLNPILQENEIGCRMIGVFLNLFGILIAAWFLNEASTLFRSFVFGNPIPNYRAILILGLIIPALLTVVPVSVTKGNQYGGDLLCLPSHEYYTFWIMAGSILSYAFLGFMMCMILTCNVETPAYLAPKVIEAMICQIKHMNQISVYIILSWVLLIVVIQFRIPYLPYTVLTLISLQGFFTFINLGLRDEELMGNAMCNPNWDTQTKPINKISRQESIDINQEKSSDLFHTQTEFVTETETKNEFNQESILKNSNFNDTMQQPGSDEQDTHLNRRGLRLHLDA